MDQIFQFVSKIYPYFLGGIGGASLTLLSNKWTKRIKKMKCYYVDDDVIAKIPVLDESGEKHNNIYTKEFRLKNTTGMDIPSFRIIFEFEADAKIIKQNTFWKAGKNDIKPKNKKPNESSYTIKNFNRGDEYRFYFDIANITNGDYNITEADCLGFKIVVKDERKPVIKNKSKVVTKDRIQ